MCQSLSLHSLILLSAMRTEARSAHILDDLPKEKHCLLASVLFLFLFFLHFWSILESTKHPPLSEVYLVTEPGLKHSQSLQWPVASI